MQLGEVYYFATSQAKGYESRPKFHVYICGANWQADGHSFLFISKADYGGDFRIEKSDYAFLTLPYSFISCGDIATYRDDELRDANPELKGSISELHLRLLYSAITGSETMTGWKIKLVCESLKCYL